MDTGSISEIVKASVVSALEASKAQNDGWEARMMIGIVAVGLLVLVAGLSAFYALAKRYMLKADDREVRMANRIDKAEDEISESGSRRENRMATALDTSAAATKEMAVAVQEMAKAVNEIRNERRAFEGFLEWLKGRACVAMSNESLETFRRVLQDRENAKQTKS